MRGRRLVAERLAATGGQDGQRIAPLEDTLDGALLQRKEAIVTPDATDRLVQELSLDDAAMIADACGRRLVSKCVYIANDNCSAAGGGSSGRSRRSAIEKRRLSAATSSFSGAVAARLGYGER
jgi:hypothetical protein